MKFQYSDINKSHRNMFSVLINLYINNAIIGESEDENLNKQ